MPEKTPSEIWEEKIAEKQFSLPSEINIKTVIGKGDNSTILLFYKNGKYCIGFTLKDLKDIVNKVSKKINEVI